MRWVFAAAAIAAAVSACESSDAGDSRARAVRDVFAADVDTLVARAESLYAAVKAISADQHSQTLARSAFDRARIAYKRAEHLIEYVAPLAASQLNGPPIDEVELDEGPTIVEPAEGFQVLESLLYPVVDTSRLAYLKGETVIVRDYCARLTVLLRSLVLSDAQVFDAIRTQIARISTLGITGFDSPVRRASLEEARESITGIRASLDPYMPAVSSANRTVGSRLDSLTRVAATRLAGDYDTFDRLDFIATVANPLAVELARARDAIGVSVPPEPRFWRASAATLFETGAFDVDFLKPRWSPPTTPERAALGERLFFDPVLSGSGTRNCASCHDPARAFTDGATTSAPLIPGRRLRNSPTLINSALQGAQFADMRTVFLEDQVADVVGNAAEMHGVLDATAAKLRADTSYARQFAVAFPGPADSTLTSRTIRFAVAAYIRTLSRLDSRVDRAMRGDTAALTAEERLGFNVFAGKGLCASCHFLPLTNGTVPPGFTRTEQEVIGVPSAAVWKGARVDPDSGRARVTRAPLHRFAFRTPTVRNIALTAPYMHNGVYRTLEEVVRFYDVGGGAGIGFELPNQTLPFDKLNLTEAEQRAVVTLLRAFTDTARTTASAAVQHRGGMRK